MKQLRSFEDLLPAWQTYARALGEAPATASPPSGASESPRLINARIASACPAWLAQQGAWLNNDVDMEVVATDIRAALLRLAGPVAPEAEDAVLDAKALALPAAVGSALGALALAPLTLLWFDNRAIGLTLGGVLGAFLVVRVIGALFDRPDILAKAQRATVEGIKDGSVDVVIGTHRLLSKDIRFKDLGLVVIDEEQRFGVKQKEKFKQLFRLVDVLTLSATPIPRTLYLSLTGARDMSTIETAPPNRHPVQTIVAPYDERVIREAIEREMARNGQVYFLHNRIHSIHDVEMKLRTLVPKARVVVGHGQMDPEELEDVMGRFVAGEADVLLSTTIIESGLDIPNANTIIIDRADRFGLADLYQLRGRVGRAQNRAYAYLFLPRHLMTVGDAKKRVSAIKQYSQLGAGFKIAMRDLEIRGAGNLLGTAQSGHITAVGFDLYCQLLKTAVARLKGEKTGRLVETKLDLDFIAWQESEADEDGGKAGAFLPKKYLAESRWRMDGYRRIAESNSAEDLDKLRNEWRDRYGPWPEQVERLLLATEIKILSSALRIRVVETQEDKLMFSQGQDYIMVSGKFPRLTASDATSRLREIISWLVSLRSAP